MRYQVLNSTIALLSFMAICHISALAQEKIPALKPGSIPVSIYYINAKSGKPLKHILVSVDRFLWPTIWINKLHTKTLHISIRAYTNINGKIKFLLPSPIPPQLLPEFYGSVNWIACSHSTFCTNNVLQYGAIPKDHCLSPLDRKRKLSWIHREPGSIYIFEYKSRWWSGMYEFLGIVPKRDMPRIPRKKMPCRENTPLDWYTSWPKHAPKN